MPLYSALKIAEEPGHPAFERTAAEVAMDLLPIAAVVVALEAGRLEIKLSNAAFRQLALGKDIARCALTRDLGSALISFLSGTKQREQRTWKTGDAVEHQWFDVTFARNENAPQPRCLVTLIDQTRGMRTEASLRREMATDSLTGLSNRAGFGDVLEARMATGLTDFAVLVVDLDRFGRVNSCLGSMAGDEMLITVARRIKGSLRGGDVLGRIGGDEFAVLLETGGDPEEVTRAAKRIRKLLATPVRLSDFEIRVTCSIGIAFAAEATSDAEDVIRNAQFAVRRSKETGEAEAYDTRALDRARKRFAMETALRRAIEAEQLTLHYQPICDLGTGRIVAFEALARWTTEDGTQIGPADFIPVAEESGLIVPLGRWVIDQALRTLAAWDAQAGAPLDIQMAVNISPIQLQRDRLPPRVAEALATHGLAGSRLKLELTESALVAGPDGSAETLKALKATGATIAMDDFGTGYSNLAYLQKLPIDTLKIDRSFVTGMMADRDKIAIVRAVLSLAATLGMATVAEGIESSAVAQTLSALGCTYGQGYQFSRPLTADRAYELLAGLNS